MMVEKIAIFPRDRDSFMTQNFPPGIVPVYLVIKGSTEDEWTKKFLDDTQVLKFNLNTNSYVTNLSLIDILNKSDIAEILKRENIHNVYIDIATEAIEAWGLEHNINFIVTPYKFRKVYENKIYFDELLEKNKIPKPASKIVEFRKEEIEMPFEGKFVLQKAVSSGGEGTYFIDNTSEINNLIDKGELVENEKYLVRKFIEGTTYGITVFVSPGTITISSIRLQCFDKDVYPNKNIFVGLQWIPADSLSQKLKNNINEVFSDLGKTLYEENFYGFANFDFQVDKNDNVYLIECNARFSAASVHYLKFLELMGNVDVSNLFLENLIHKNQHTKNYDVHEFPNSNFSGSLLKINIYPDIDDKTIEITKDCDIGVYSNTNNEFIFVDSDIRNIALEDRQFIFSTDAKIGEKYEKFSEIYRVFSNYPLFDFYGNINLEGQKIKNYFKL